MELNAFKVSDSIKKMMDERAEKGLKALDRKTKKGAPIRRKRGSKFYPTDATAY